MVGGRRTLQVTWNYESADELRRVLLGGWGSEELADVVYREALKEIRTGLVRLVSSRARQADSDGPEAD